MNNNSFINNFKNIPDAYTTNGARAHSSTGSAVYDFFSLAGAMRKRTDDDILDLFYKAMKENAELALRCLFYLSDCRGGQGERRLFRVCFKWLCQTQPNAARALVQLIPEFRRWDDVFYACVNTAVEKDAFNTVKRQLAADMQTKTPSLCAKWCPSINASSDETRKIANNFRNYLGMTCKQYRKMLSKLRNQIKVTERLMSDNRWNELEFDKIPSNAGLKYSKAFRNREETSERYLAFINNKNTKVHAATLYPYDIVQKMIPAVQRGRWGGRPSTEDINTWQKFWDALPDYMNGTDQRIMCVVDSSGSMMGTPMNIAFSLGIYCAEHLGGAFHNNLISFSETPKFINFDKCHNIYEKVKTIWDNSEVANTNLTRTFNLVLEVAKHSRKEDIPSTILVISDMQIDSGRDRFTYGFNVETEMEAIRRDWKEVGLEMPKLVYWNVNASQNTILDKSDGVSYVSGASPVIMQQVLTGKTGYMLMMDAIMQERYDVISKAIF